MRHAPGIGVALVIAGALAACDAPRPARPALWTLSDVQRLYEERAEPTDAIATDAGLPGGVALGSMLSAADRRSLTVEPAFAEGYPVGYVTTEVWANFDEVWAQPVYVPVAGWANGTPQMPSDKPIFSVGADSLFYSPFWQMIYVEMPPDAATSVRGILDGKYPLHPSRPWTAALTPPNFGLGGAVPAGGAIAGTGWLDGAPAPFIKFPATPFGIGDDNVVEEVPIFHFVVVNDAGRWTAAPIPTVLGAGPLYSHTLPPIDNVGLPTAKYSGYWRVHVVVLPPTVRAFAPPGSDLATALANAGVPVDAPYSAEVIAAANAGQLNDFLGRVALDGACFDTVNRVNQSAADGSCRYLDSQEAIEQKIARDAIVATDVTVTCPIVSINGMAVQ